MKRISKFICVALAVAMVAGILTGCGKNEGDGEGGSQTADPGQLVWSSAFYKLPEEFQYFSAAAISEDTIYIASYLEETDETALYTMSTDAQTKEPLPGYVPTALPEGVYGNASVDNIAVDAEGMLWVSERVMTYTYEFPEDVEITDENRENYRVYGDQQYYIRRLDSTGAELAVIDITELANSPEGFYLSGLATDGENNVYFTDGNQGVFAYNAEGEQLLALRADNWTQGVFALADGRVGLCCYVSGSGYSIFPIDLSKKAFASPIATNSTDADICYTGSGDTLFYADIAGKLCAYKTETQEFEEVLDWLSCDVDYSNILAMDVREDGSILCICYGQGSGGNELVVITQRPAGEATQKTTLTLATIYTDYNLRAQVLNFNRSSESYRIEIKDYGNFATEDEPNGNITKLNTEIISGVVPDMIAVDSLPLNHYAAIGLLEDLYPYLDADGELSRESIMPSMLRAMENDGHLYQAAASFGITSLVGRSDLVGEEMGWTTDELIEVFNQLPEGTSLMGEDMPRELLLYYLCAMNLGSYVDWNTGECYFDSEDFRDLLRFCEQFSADVDIENIDDVGMYEALATGRILLTPASCSSFEDMQVYDAIFNGNVTFKGIPSANRDGNVIVFGGGVAMTSKCSDKEGAWEFIRTLFTEEYQADNVYSFPTNQAAFDAALKEAMTPTYSIDPVTGEQVEESHGGAVLDGVVEVQFYATTQEEADVIMELINSVSRRVDFDENITEIITEESAKYFSGQNTIDQTVELIQSRVSIYINEQR